MNVKLAHLILLWITYTFFNFKHLIYQYCAIICVKQCKSLAVLKINGYICSIIN